MTSFDIILLVLLAISIVISIFTMSKFASVKKEISDYRVETAHTINDSFHSFGTILLENQKAAAANQDKRLAELNEKFNQTSLENEQKLENIRNTMDGVDKTIEAIKQDFGGLIFTNLVDFDSLYGHRRNPSGYGNAIMDFDKRIPEIIDAMTPEDVLIITADHGTVHCQADSRFV